MKLLFKRINTDLWIAM